MPQTHVPSTAMMPTHTNCSITVSLIFVPMYFNRCFPLLKLYLQSQLNGSVSIYQCREEKDFSNGCEHRTVNDACGWHNETRHNQYNAHKKTNASHHLAEAAFVFFFLNVLNFAHNYIIYCFFFSLNLRREVYPQKKCFTKTQKRGRHLCRPH